MSNTLIANSLQEIIQYRPAQLKTGKCWYIWFYAYNPKLNRLSRSRIKVNQIKKKTERRLYANELMKRINRQLEAGWTPFSGGGVVESQRSLSDVIKSFLLFVKKKADSGIIIPDTYLDYKSDLSSFLKWITVNFGDNFRVCDLKKKIASEFLDYIFVTKGLSAQTRNNYLNRLRVFAGWLVEKEYTPARFTNDIKSLRKTEKQRTIIDKRDRARIRSYCLSKNKNFWLACMIQYYCFIRPIELTRLKLSNISFSDQTIRMTADQSKKSRKPFVVTIPAVLVKIMIDCNIQDYPSGDYLFSDANTFSPGPEPIKEDAFRDFWLVVRKKLKLPDSYKFYSFKDSGITDLIDYVHNPRVVRDQARHSDISITDIYTARTREANEDIKKINYTF